MTDPDELLRTADERLASGEVAAAIEACVSAAIAFRRAARHEPAIDAYARAASLARADGDVPGAAALEVGAIDSLGVVGRVDEALALADRLHQVLMAHGRQVDAARVRMNVANLHYRRDLHERAAAEFRAAGALFREAGAAELAALADANLANTLAETGDVAGALERSEMARIGFAALGLARESAMLAVNEAGMLAEMGRYGASLATFARAIEAFANLEVPTSVERAKTEADRAEVYLSLNLLPEAAQAFEAAVALFDSVPLPVEAARARVGRAAVARLQGQGDSARVDLQAADAAFAAQDNPFWAARVWLEAARNGDPARLEDARNAFSRLGRPGWAAQARFQQMLGESGPRRSLRTLAAIVRTARRTGRGWLECQALGQMASVCRERQERGREIAYRRRAVAALESVRAEMSAPEEYQIAFVSDKLAVYEELVTVLLERGGRSDVDEAFEVVARSKSRLLFERMERGAPGTDDPALLARREALRAALRQHYRGLRDDAQTTRRDAVSSGATVDILEAQYQTAARALELDRSAAASRPGAESSALARRVSERLDARTALLEYCVAGDTVHAFLVLPGERPRFFRSLCRQGVVASLARRLRYQLQSASMGSALRREGADDVLARLYDALLAPVAGECAGVERLVVVPHGCLHGLPFHAFRHGDVHVIDRWEVVYAPSTTLWLRGGSRPAQTLDSRARALVLGLPLPGLEMIGAEIAAVAGCFRDSVSLCGPEATTDAFLGLAPKARCVHLATHARFRADNPTFSGLELADGWLMAHDVAELDLNGVDLAVLSACHTAVQRVAPGDELQGVARAFLGAGARSLVASQWAAQDAATHALMEELYRHLLCAGTGAASALRHAQRRVRTRYAHPYLWAAFVVMGQG